jgi:predicted dehydrogenase
MEKNKPVGIAVIGYGYWSPKLIRNIRENPRFSLKIICEKNTSLHSRVAEENPGIAVMEHYRDVFSRADIDAVIVATIPSSHFRIAKQALEAGKHTLVEKPLALNSRDAELLINIAEKKQRVLMVDHTYLYTPAIHALRDCIAANELGDINSFDSNRVNLGLFQRDTNVVWDLAPHDISILLHLFAERPKHVIAVGSKTKEYPRNLQTQVSTAHISLLYSHFVANIDVSWISPRKIRQITVIGSERSALYDQLAPQQLTIYDQGVVSKKDGEQLFEYKKGETKSVALSISDKDDIGMMLEDFAKSAQEGVKPVSNSALSLDVVRILEAVSRSMKYGGRKERVSYISSPRIFGELQNMYLRFRHGY